MLAGWQAEAIITEEKPVAERIEDYVKGFFSNFRMNGEIKNL
jgi:hypothetical protein